MLPEPMRQQLESKAKVLSTEEQLEQMRQEIRLLKDCFLTLLHTLGPVQNSCWSLAERLVSDDGEELVNELVLDMDRVADFARPLTQKWEARKAELRALDQYATKEQLNRLVEASRRLNDAFGKGPWG